MIPGAMIEPVHPLQIEGFRRMTPAQKLSMTAALYEAGIQLRSAGLRMAHPDPRYRSGNPALRSPLLKCSASSGRLQILAKIPWLIVNQGSMRCASVTSSLALSS